jgi:hypothetical protein
LITFPTALLLVVELIFSADEDDWDDFNCCELCDDDDDDDEDDEATFNDDENEPLFSFSFDVS